MQLASTASPRSANNSATCSYASGYRKYQRTAVRITSPEYWRPLNGLAAVIDMPYRTKSGHSNFAMEPTALSAKALQHLSASRGISSPVACGIARPTETSPVPKGAADNRRERLESELVSAGQR